LVSTYEKRLKVENQWFAALRGIKFKVL